MIDLTTLTLDQLRALHTEILEAQGGDEEQKDRVMSRLLPHSCTDVTGGEHCSRCDAIRGSFSGMCPLIPYYTELTLVGEMIKELPEGEWELTKKKTGYRVCQFKGSTATNNRTKRVRVLNIALVAAHLESMKRNVEWEMCRRTV